jgi:hypothetical protein
MKALEMRFFKLAAVLMLASLLVTPTAWAEAVPGAADFELGRRFYEGEGSTHDYVKAAAHFEAAAEAGNVYARYMQGVLAKAGAGVERSPSDALRHFLAAAGPLRSLADQGDALAQRLLGQMYQEADGLPHDMAQAKRYFALAAEQGDALSQLQLARYYALGMTVKPDPGKARQWYERAAAQGLSEAQYELAVLLLTNDPVSADKDLALRWLAAAAKRNFPGVQVHPPLFSAKLMLEDSDGDGRLAPGEEGRARVFVKNHGGPAKDVRVVLETPEDVWLEEMGRALPLGDLPPGEWGEVVFTLRVSRDYSGPAEATLQAVVSEAHPENTTYVSLTLPAGRAR